MTRKHGHRWRPLMGDNKDIVFSDGMILPNRIIFQVDDQVVLELTKDGFIYQGETIKDAGKAYDIFMQAMKKLRNI